MQRRQAAELLRAALAPRRGCGKRAIAALAAVALFVERSSLRRAALAASLLSDLRIRLVLLDDRAALAAAVDELLDALAARVGAR